MPESKEFFDEKLMNRRGQGIIMCEAVLNRIMQNQGQVFYTITNLPFTYEVQSGSLLVNRANYIIPLSDISKALQLLPCAGPGAIGKTVHGSSYIWAILNDPRVQMD